MLPLTRSTANRVVPLIALLAMAATLSGQTRTVLSASRVNDSVALDWSSLNGVTVYAVDNNYIRTLTSTVRYVETQDSTGMKVLERYATSDWDQGYRYHYRDDVRTLLYPNRDAHEYFHRTPLQQTSDVAEVFEWQLLSGAWQVIIDSRPGSAHLTPGVVPPQLVRGFVAALPDPLPTSVTLWSFTWDTNPKARDLVIRFDFGRRERLKVPIAPPGAECGPDTRVARNDVEVVWVTQEAEGKREEYPVLAIRPHVAVDTAATRCISLPRNHVAH